MHLHVLTILPKTQNFHKAVKCTLDSHLDLTYGFYYNIVFLCVSSSKSYVSVLHTHTHTRRIRLESINGRVLLEKLFLPVSWHQKVRQGCVNLKCRYECIPVQERQLLNLMQSLEDNHKVIVGWHLQKNLQTTDSNTAGKGDLNKDKY